MKLQFIAPYKTLGHTVSDMILCLHKLGINIIYYMHFDSHRFSVAVKQNQKVGFLFDLFECHFARTMIVLWGGSNH